MRDLDPTLMPRLLQGIVAGHHRENMRDINLMSETVWKAIDEHVKHKLRGSYIQLGEDVVQEALHDALVELTKYQTVYCHDVEGHKKINAMLLRVVNRATWRIAKRRSVERRRQVAATTELLERVSTLRCGISNYALSATALTQATHEVYDKLRGSRNARLSRVLEAIGHDALFALRPPSSELLSRLTTKDIGDVLRSQRKRARPLLRSRLQKSRVPACEIELLLKALLPSVVMSELTLSVAA